MSYTVPVDQIPGLLIPAFRDTVIMVGVVMAIVLVIGVPLGALVHNVAPGGLIENSVVHQPLSWVISIGRSLPFLVLMTSIIPFTRLLTGTNIGIPAAVVPMSIAGIAFFARIVENSLRALPAEVDTVARASGGSTTQIIWGAQIPEALPNIVGGLTINTIAMIEYSTIAGTIGAGGLGYVAVTYGYERFDHGVMIGTIITLVVTVTAIQLAGDALVRHLTPGQTVLRKEFA
ncbi:methionine ABC transporter permease [Tsukamurella soli]